VEEKENEAGRHGAGQGVKAIGRGGGRERELQMGKSENEKEAKKKRKRANANIASERGWDWIGLDERECLNKLTRGQEEWNGMEAESDRAEQSSAYNYPFYR
jgi:hypothetical protein